MRVSIRVGVDADSDVAADSLFGPVPHRAEP